VNTMLMSCSRPGLFSDAGAADDPSSGAEACGRRRAGPEPGKSFLARAGLSPGFTPSPGGELSFLHSTSCESGNSAQMNGPAPASAYQPQINLARIDYEVLGNGGGPLSLSKVIPSCPTRVRLETNERDLRCGAPSVNIRFCGAVFPRHKSLASRLSPRRPRERDVVRRDAEIAEIPEK